MLSFLSPLFLLGAAAAALPIVLHLLKRQPETRVRFAAVKLLRDAPVETTARRRLRELLLLALRVAALVLLTLAFARPFFDDTEAAGPTGLVVVALDTSLSLSAPGQLARAKELARDAIGRVPAGHLVAVITFAEVAQIAAAPSADRALATSAVDAATAGNGATRYRAALSAAADLVASFGGDENALVVVTDLLENGWDRGDRVSLPASVRVELADVGALPPNLALTGVRLSSGDRIVVTIRNSGPEARETRVHLSVDGQPVGDQVLSVGPGTSGDATLEGAPGTAAAVSVEDQDGVQADNVRYAVLGSAARPSVLFVTASGDLAREAFYAEQALTASGAGGATYEAEAVAASQLSGWSAAQLDRHAVVVVTSTRGLERRGREALDDYVRRGGGLLMVAGPEVDGEVAAGALGGLVSITVPPESAPRDPRGEGRSLVPVDARHPVFLAFGAGQATLGLVRFERVATVDGLKCRTLARFTTGETALVECAIGDGRAFVIAADLNNVWNDFPLHATFVPFLHETVRYLAGERARVGEYLVGEGPVGTPRTPGVVTVPDAAGAAGRLVAINVDPRESDPARLSSDQFHAAITRVESTSLGQGQAVARQREERQHLWQYLFVLMVAMLALESFVSTRTI